MLLAGLTYWCRCVSQCVQLQESGKQQRVNKSVALCFTQAGLTCAVLAVFEFKSGDAAEQEV